jgi:hypothetical protein
MASAYNIIRRALKIIRVVDANEAPEAVEAADALDTLNGMLAEWHYAGIDLPEYSFTDLQDTLSTDAADSDAISYQLAERLAPEYGKELSPAGAKASAEAFGRLRLRYFQPGATDYSELPGAACRSFDIEAG